MPMELDGNLLAAKIKVTLKSEIARLRFTGYRVPHMYVLVVGTDAEIASQVNDKQEACSLVDMLCTTSHYTPSIVTSVLLSKIAQLNRDPLVDGIIVQMPLPAHIDVGVLLAIAPEKDVAGAEFLTGDTLNGLDAAQVLPLVQDRNNSLSVAIQLRNTLSSSIARQWECRINLDRGLFPMFRSVRDMTVAEVENNLVQDTPGASFTNSMS